MMLRYTGIREEGADTVGYSTQEECEKFIIEKQGKLSVMSGYHVLVLQVAKGNIRYVPYWIDSFGYGGLRFDLTHEDAFEHATKVAEVPFRIVEVHFDV